MRRRGKITSPKSHYPCGVRSANPVKPGAQPLIRLLVLDVDGVLTDGRLYFGARGEELKAFHVRDGYGLRRLAAEGVILAVISGRRSGATLRRCRELGVRHVIQGASNKLAAFERLRKRLAVAAAECACVGDDTPDLPLFVVAGLAFAVADAHPAVLGAAHIVTTLQGGHGAVREVCDYLLAARERRTRRR